MILIQRSRIKILAWPRLCPLTRARPRKSRSGSEPRSIADSGMGKRTPAIILAGTAGGGSLYSQVQVASIDTLLSRMVRRNRITLADPDVIVIDEAHLSITKTRQALLDRWPRALRVGLTATPTRKDGRALGALYDDLIEPVTVADLVRDGYLVRGRYFSVSDPDLQRCAPSLGTSIKASSRRL